MRIYTCLAAILLLGAIACGGADTTPSGPQSANIPTAAEPAEPVPGPSNVASSPLSSSGPFVPRDAAPATP
jgi:hypothetical protein